MVEPQLEELDKFTYYDTFIYSDSKGERAVHLRELGCCSPLEEY